MAKRKAPRTAFKPGHEKVGGRKKGTRNKFSGELKTLVLDALANSHQGGAQSYLQQQAKKNPRSFLQLIAKLLPTQVTGKDDGPLAVLIEKAQGNLSALSDKELATLQALLKKIGLASTEEQS